MQKQIISSHTLPSFTFTPAERVHVLKHGRDPKPSLSLKKHHRLCGSVGSIQNQCVLTTEDARSTASIMGEHFAFKINDLWNDLEVFGPSFHLPPLLQLIAPSLLKKKATTNLERRPGRLLYFLVSQEQQYDTQPAVWGTPVCGQLWARQDTRRVRFSTAHRLRNLLTKLTWSLRCHRQKNPKTYSVLFL